MPLIDYKCVGCDQGFEALIGTHQDYPEPTECPDCGSAEIKREWTFEGHVSQTTFAEPVQIRADLRHKRDIERAYAKGTLVDCKEKGPLEFRPKFPKRLH